jgi:hypothetical protein
VVKDENGGLQFLVHPELRKHVQADDLAYIESLLRDFARRAKLHPDALFQQLCSLAVGPLIVQETGPHLGECPELLHLVADFIQAGESPSDHSYGDRSEG